MKVCEQCGVEFGKRRTEAYWQYEARRCCSKRCSGLLLNPRLPNDQFASRYRKVKTPDGRNMLEYRYVMEQMIGRRLKRWEQVHHKNHDGLDNRPENLELVTSRQHGHRHTRHATVKVCVICQREFTPHKTKRVRQQTCGDPACKSELLSQRNRDHQARQEAA